MYRLLSNPFYAGIILWNGQSYPGKHEPIVLIDEFRMVRRLIDRPNRPRPKRHAFTFRGMIRCGACGLRVTAERKVKRSGRQYTYYHCARPRLRQKCAEPSIEAQELERHATIYFHRSQHRGLGNRELAVDRERLMAIALLSHSTFVSRLATLPLA
nr:zinc ribbon domain-containing protein [Bradyrhizobium liaoningense]